VLQNILIASPNSPYYLAVWNLVSTHLGIFNVNDLLSSEMDTSWAIEPAGCLSRPPDDSTYYGSRKIRTVLSNNSCPCTAPEVETAYKRGE
jgi:hypothetical protein